MKTTGCAMALLLALSACASSGPLAPEPQTCPKPPPLAAWIMEPAPSLVQMLDSVISPSEEPSAAPANSSPPAKPALAR
jgi:hypothetical protein